MITEIIKKYSPARLCELGCGYGYNLSYLKKCIPDVYGGEYAENAITIAKKIDLNVKRFNFYESISYELIKPHSTILTVHRVEQMPSAQSFIEALNTNKNKIDRVIHFEPSFFSERTNLIVILRNRYIELNDYNRDLYSILSKRKDIRIIEQERDIIAMNPLNPSTLSVWEFIKDVL